MPVVTALWIINSPASCEPPKIRENAGNIISIVMRRSRHFSNHFSVFGSRYATIASGERTTRITISAWRVASTTITSSTAKSPDTRAGNIR
ncbi:hypothetical protein D3C85_1117360 [compost metagenome]